MQWLIRTDEPFRGSAQSYILDDGTVAYTKGLAVEAYAADRGFPVKVISDSELDAMSSAYVATLVTEATEESESQWDYALGVLPPSRWRTARGVESFHICERIYADLVSWHAKIGNRFFTFNDRSALSAEQVAEKVALAMESIR